MKKALLSVIVLLFVFSGVLPCRAGVPGLADNEEHNRRIEQGQSDLLLLYGKSQGITHLEDVQLRFNWNKKALALDKAVEDIAAHIPFLLLLRKEFGEIFHLEWAIPIAEKLPSQPAAVIRLMAISNETFRHIDLTEIMCPWMVIEDTPIYFSQYKDWMERAVATLEAITMNDALEEKTRMACLQNIKDALTTTRPWDLIHEYK